MTFKLTCALTLTLGLFASLAHASSEVCALPGKTNPKKSLVITDLSVVNDARAQGSGPWSFARVFAGTLPGATALGEAAYAWMDLFGTVDAVNGYPIAPRVPGPILEHWPAVGQGSGVAGVGTNRDVTRAPLRLLAIVYRPDLVDAATAPAGEGRLIYGATDPMFGTKNLTLTFEFALPTDLTLPGGQKTSPRFWRESFANLSLVPFGPAYNARLEALTALFVESAEGRSHILQVRTNEQFFGQGWDLREFRPDAGQARLVQVPVAQTPDPSLNTANATELIQWIKANADDIGAERHKLPQKFLGASGFLIDDLFFWLKDAGLKESTRGAFARATCNGCHGGETGTRFLHIAPRLAVEPAKLSRFLIGDTIRRKSILDDAVCP